MHKLNDTCSNKPERWKITEKRKLKTECTHFRFNNTAYRVRESDGGVEI